MYIFYITLFIINICLPVNAGVIFLDKNQVAPYSGYLLDSSAELKARTALNQNDSYKELVENQYEMINTLHQQNKLLDAKIYVLSNNQDSFLSKILYTIGGVIIGGLIVNSLKN